MDCAASASSRRMITCTGYGSNGMTQVTKRRGREQRFRWDYPLFHPAVNNITGFSGLGLGQPRELGAPWEAACTMSTGIHVHLAELVALWLTAEWTLQLPLPPRRRLQTSERRNYPGARKIPCQCSVEAGRRVGWQSLRLADALGHTGAAGT